MAIHVYNNGTVGLVGLEFLAIGGFVGLVLYYAHVHTGICIAASFAAIVVLGFFYKTTLGLVVITAVATTAYCWLAATATYQISAGDMIWVYVVGGAVALVSVSFHVSAWQYLRNVIEH